MTEPNEINQIIKDPTDPRYPCQLGVFCDVCGTEWVGDFLVTDDDTHARRLEIVRNHVRENEGWDCGAAGDFCPDCGRPAGARTLGDVLALIEQHDTNYPERYALVFEAVHLAQAAGHAAGIRIDPDEPEWPVVYIQLPTGQVSWHMPQFADPWDGHTTEEKYRRIRALRDAAEDPSPAVEVPTDAPAETTAYGRSAARWGKGDLYYRELPGGKLEMAEEDGPCWYVYRGCNTMAEREANKDLLPLTRIPEADLPAVLRTAVTADEMIGGDV